MDADVDSAWICTQAVVSTDCQSNNEQEKINNYGYIVLKDMIDNGRYILNEGDNTIGRHPLNYIYIEHPSVSMNHAVIQCDSDGVVLLDKGSLNKTKLNKKTLRKDVAYFLEENAVLMFGEVQADYFMNGESNEFTNDTKSIASDNTFVHKETQNDGLSLSKLSNTIITTKSFKTDIPNAISDCNVSLAIENSSTCKIENEVPKTITGSGCAMNTLNDIHTKLNSSSPNDEYLLEALSQVETNQNNKEFHNISNKDTSMINLTKSMTEMTREDTPSPVMDLKSSILSTNNITKNLFQSPNKINTETIREDTPSPVMDLKSSILSTNNITKNLFQSPNKINTETIREDTPSPVMDLKSSILTTDNITKNLFQSPNNINTEKLREDTPSPVLDLNNSIFITNNTPKNLFQSSSKINTELTLENTPNNNPIKDLRSNNDFKNEVDELNDTQVLEIDNNIVELYTQTSKPLSSLINQLNTNKLDMPDVCTSKSTSLCGSTPIEDNKFLNLSTLKIDRSCNKTQTDELDFFDCPTQKISTFKTVSSSITINQSVFQKKNATMNNSNSFDANYVHSNNSSSGSNNMNLSTKCSVKSNSAQNRSIDYLKTVTNGHNKDKHKRNVNTFEADDDDIFRNFIEEECNAQQQDLAILENQDFFNCPTQKILTNKNINLKSKITYSIHKEEETKKHIDPSKPFENNASTSKSYSNYKMKNLTTISGEMDDDDFFNCPTQKVSITKKIFPNSKVISSINDEETQRHLELKQLNKINTITSETYPSNKHKNLTQIPEMDDDFFSCPTQKVSNTKKVFPNTGVSSSIHEEETQRPTEVTQSNKANNITPKNYPPNIHENLTEVLKKDDDDFFNCPTQKLSFTKKIDPKPKVSSSIHDEETQPLLELHKPIENIASASKSYNISKLEDLTKISGDIDDDDFFKCPTQKVSITKKILSSIHDEETQRPPEFSQFNKTSSISSKNNPINIHEDLTEDLKKDYDFFNCPTQKLSFTKKIDPKPKVSSSIHDEETQPLLELHKPDENIASASKCYNISKLEDLTKISGDIDDDDFFKCPTQKVSITKKILSSIHDEETQRPPEFSQFNKTSSISSKNNPINIHEDLTEDLKKDYDFFNCPTQKLSITKKISLNSKVTPTIHEEETQRPPEFSQFNKTSSISSKNHSTNIHEDLTEVLKKDDDDFFNCPTQKVSFIEKIHPKPKLSLSIHDEETQKPPEFEQFNKTDNISSKTYFTNKHEDLTNVLKVDEDDDDFFNCPTQKVSLIKKIKPKVSTSIHDEETQRPPEFSQFNKTSSISSKNHSTNIHEDLTEVLKKDDDDFFNCPTQKVSFIKKINPKPKVSLSIHEEETQRPPEFAQFSETDNITSKTYFTNKHKDITNVLKIDDDDDDFFNCPTQKLLITKKISLNSKETPTIHEEETQKPPEFAQFSKTDNISSKTYITNKHEDLTNVLKIDDDDDDFFNCPTQKVSLIKKIKPKVSTSIHDEETQRPPEFSQFNKTSSISSKNYSTNSHGDLTEVLKKDDDDFFNCATQKVSFIKKINPKPKVSLSIHEEETQRPPEFSQFNKTSSISSKNYSTNSHGDLTEVLKEDDDDFFNCPTQKVSFIEKINPKPKVSLSIHEEETQRPPEFSQINRTNSITSKNNPTSIHENSILNRSVSKIGDILKDSEHFDGSKNHKQTVGPDNNDICKVKKSKHVNSNTISISNAQLPVENSSNSFKINEPTIQFREDLPNSYFGDSSNNSTIILNKPIENTAFKNKNTTVLFNKNFDSPCCSKTSTSRESYLNASSSTKQKDFTDDSVQSEVSVSLNYNHQMKRIDESIFSPLNIPDVSANSLSEHRSSPKIIQNNLITLNCEPSTSSNNASEWKSFWNKKKVQSQDKGKSDKQKSIKIMHEVKENKERYQTRAITRKENALNLNKKRKQDGVEESNKKICNRNNILEPLVENSSEIVVSFSYLKKLHEMKQFVDKTGGTVTDDITQCTVLVTDKIRCTMKILSAIAKGCPIVNANWLKHSYTVKMFQDVDDFIIVDKDAERKYKFQLKESLAKAKTKRLLDGYNVLVTPSVKPSPQEMKVIITCAGGNYVLNWATTQYTKELIVTCDKDRNRWKPAWDNDLAKIIDSDTLVMSIVRQKLTI